MKRSLICATAVLLLSFPALHMSFADSASDSGTSAPAPKKKSGFFKKLGSYVASETLGVDVPSGRDDPAEEASPSPSSPEESSASPSSGREPTRSEIDKAMHDQMAMMQMDMSKKDQEDLEMARHTRIPKNVTETMEMEQAAREKGFLGCWSWIHPVRPEDLAKMTPEERRMADEYQKSVSKGKKMMDLTPEQAVWYCRHQIMEAKYQLAKASGDPKKIKQMDAEYAEFSRQMDAVEKSAAKKKK